MAAACDIVAIGEPLYELNQQPDGRFLPGFGGDTSNAAIAAARLGARTSYVSRLGGDMFGDAIAALWQRERVDASHVVRDPQAPTGLYFVTHGATGHAFTYRRTGSAASLMTAADLPAGLITAARFVHCSGISQAISRSAADAVVEAIGLARAAGVKVSYDTNFRPKLWTAAEAWPVIRAAAERADILKTSSEDCMALIGVTDPEDIASRFLALGSRTVLVTLGRDGVLLAGAQGMTRLEGFRVGAVDATGAGDAFTGALLAELSRGAGMLPAVRFANAAAALSTLGYGAIAPLPARPAVMDFMESGSAGA